MSFEAELLVKTFVAPLAVSTLIVWLWSRFARESLAAPLGRRILVGVAWWLASMIVLAIQVQSPRFQETWQQADYLVWIVALAACIAPYRFKTTGVWLLAGLLVAIVLYASLPRGDGWNDMATTKYGWWSLGIIAWLANSRWWPSEVDLTSTLSKGWFIGTIASYQAALAICAFSCYASLGEWSLSLVATTIPFAALASRFGGDSMRPVLWQVFAVGSLIAISAVLYGADPGSVALAIFMPTFAGVLDNGCRFLAFSQKWRIWIVAIGSCLILLLVMLLSVG